MNHSLSKHRLTTPFWVGVALLLAIYLCVSLTLLGWEKYYYILAGGRRFATFPNVASSLGISLTYLVLVLLHLVWVLSPNGFPSFAQYSKVLRYSSIFLLLAFIAYPLGNDVYLYLHYGWMNLHRVDPFLTPAGDFISPLTPILDWKQTATYGPVSQILFSLAAIALPVHAIVAVYVFKLFCLIAHILNGYLVWRLTPKQIQTKFAIAYLLCPLLLFEQVASAHVDVFISTCILLTVACVYTQRDVLAFLTLWLGFLSKTIPIIWMPLLGLFLIRQRRWRSLTLGILLSCTIIGILSVTLLRNIDAWRSLLNPGVMGQYQSSIHALIRAGLETLPFFVPEAPPASEYKYALLALTRYTLFGFAIFYGITAWRMLRRRFYTAASLVEDIGWVTLVLLLYSTSWLVPWYASIFYAIAVVVPSARLFGLTALMFGVSSSAMYWLQWDAGLRSLCTIGLPTLTLIMGALVLRDRPLSSHPQETSRSNPP